jgi:hypothetical protein
MKIYIAGKITGLSELEFKIKFAEAGMKLKSEGHTPLLPSILPGGLEHEEYMHICYAMIDVCDAVYFLDNWKDSKGAKMEHDYAISRKMIRIYEEDNQ